MASLPPALEALEARLGAPVEDADRPRALAALEDATVLVLAEVSARTAALWEAGAAPRVVELVVLTAARRGFENPRGILSETLGEHTVSVSSSTANGVYLTSLEAATIARLANPRRVGSVRTPSAYATPRH